MHKHRIFPPGLYPTWTAENITQDCVNGFTSEYCICNLGICVKCMKHGVLQGCLSSALYKAWSTTGMSVDCTVQSMEYYRDVCWVHCTKHGVLQGCLLIALYKAWSTTGMSVECTVQSMEYYKDVCWVHCTKHGVLQGCLLSALHTAWITTGMSVEYTIQSMEYYKDVCWVHYMKHGIQRENQTSSNCMRP